MAEWRTTTLGELGALYDGPHATPERRDSGPYFLNIASLNSGRLDLTQSDHVSPEDFAAWTRRVTPQEGDLLFSYETRLGEAAMMPAGVGACLGRRMALIRPDRTLVDPRFLLYRYLSPAMQETIEQHTIHGATVNRISLSTMGSWTLDLPSLGEQRAIAEVLGALDDKIAANTRLATTAEALALAIAAAATPSVPLRDVARAARTTTNPADLAEAAVDLFSLPGFDAGQVPEHVSPDSIKSGKFTIDRPAVLVSKLNPRIPRVWEVPTIGDVPALASTEFVVLHPAEVTSAVLWTLVAQPAFSAALESMVAGTSGSHQRVKPDEVMSALVGNPADLTELARAEIDTICGRAHLARAENQNLAATRDALLPALMSGALRVRDAERLAEHLT